MKDLINDPQRLWQIAVVSSAAIPVIVIFVRWFWGATKDEVKKEVINNLKQDNEAFKNLMEEQMEVVKDTVEVVKDSIVLMKKDNEISHKQNKQMLDIMMLHIDELTHVKGKVDEHEGRITNIERLK